FTYALTGWEGSATDACIYEDALSDDLIIPPGKYLLADARFPSCDGLLVPYHGIRYHLAEWGRAGVRPMNKEELFNLRHSSARNVIERIFGVLKHRFHILLLSPEYSMEIQARIPAALCAAHNFIRTHDPDEELAALPNNLHFDYENPGHQGMPDEQPGPGDGDEFGLGGEDMRARHDHIAHHMWTDYQSILEER
ncbi:hypothetical protein AZE42_13458, partial [Rhizopogon vesiculosus]